MAEHKKRFWADIGERMGKSGAGCEKAAKDAKIPIPSMYWVASCQVDKWYVLLENVMYLLNFHLNTVSNSLHEGEYRNEQRNAILDTLAVSYLSNIYVPVFYPTNTLSFSSHTIQKGIAQIRPWVW